MMVDRLGTVHKDRAALAETLLNSDVLLSPQKQKGVLCTLKDVKQKIEHVVKQVETWKSAIESKQGMLSGLVSYYDIVQLRRNMDELHHDYINVSVEELMPVGKIITSDLTKEGILPPVEVLQKHWAEKLESLLTLRKELCVKLKKPRQSIQEAQNKRSQWKTLEGIDEMLRRLCAFDENPADCHPGAMLEYSHRLEKGRANNAHNSVHMSDSAFETAQNTLAQASFLIKHLAPLLPDYFKYQGLKSVAEMTPLEQALWRSVFLRSLTVGHDHDVATDPNYRYKNQTQTDLRMHPAAMAVEDDKVRHKAMIACLSQVLADRQHNILTPLLAEDMLNTLETSTVCTEAPSGIPTIKQTPKTRPKLTTDKLMELLDEDVQPQWRRALGMDAGTVEIKAVTELASSATGESLKAKLEGQPLRTGYTPAKREMELLLLLTHARAKDRGSFVK